MFVDVDHTFAPGAFDLPLKTTTGFAPYLFQEDVLDYHSSLVSESSQYLNQGKPTHIVYIFRNPLDVYRSYADLFDQRLNLKNIVEYPANPHVPFGHAIFNSKPENPFQHFIDSFHESGFLNYFLAQVSSFLALKETYPNLVHIMRFEKSKDNLEKYLRSIFNKSGLRLRRGSSMSVSFQKAASAVQLRNMRSYEKKLGHSISGAKTFYGEVNQSHFSARRKAWQSVFNDSICQEVWDQIEDHNPEICRYIPELNPSALQQVPRTRKGSD